MDRSLSSGIAAPGVPDFPGADESRNQASMVFKDTWAANQRSSAGAFAQGIKGLAHGLGPFAAQTGDGQQIVQTGLSHFRQRGETLPEKPSRLGTDALQAQEFALEHLG